MRRSMSGFGVRNIVNDWIGNGRNRYPIGNEGTLSLIMHPQIEPDPISILTRVRDDFTLFLGGAGLSNRAHELSDVAGSDPPELTDARRYFAAFAIEAIQQGFARLASKNATQFPSEVVCRLDSRIQSKTAKRGDLMRGISDEEHTTGTQPLGNRRGKRVRIGPQDLEIQLV